MQLKKYWLLPVLTVLVFHFPALLCDFAWDDVTLVQTNGSLSTTGFAEFFAQDYGTHLGAGDPVGYYRPLFVSLLSLIYRAAGPSPLVFHAFSLLLMCAASVLVTILCRATIRTSALLPVLAGCLYAAHPARSEVVSLVMSMPDLIVEMCCLGVALLLVSGSKIRPLPKSAGVAIISLIAVTTKESSFFLLAGIGAGAGLHFLMKEKRLGAELLPCAAVLVMLGAGMLLNHAAGIVRPGLSAYLHMLLTAGSASALRILFEAARDLVVPGTPVFIASVEAAPSLFASLGVIALIAAAALTGWRLCRSSLPACILFCWLGAGMFSLMLIGAVSVPYSQRYVPVAPAVVGIAFLMARWRTVYERPIFKPLAIAYIVTQGIFSLSGSMVCQNNLTLFRFVADQQPGLVYPRLFLADRLFYEYRDYDAMQACALEGIRIGPSSPETAGLWKLMARKSLAEGDSPSAWAMLANAERIRKQGDAELLWLKAICLLEERRPDAALPLLEESVALEPDNAEYRDLLNQVKMSGAN